jgi:hypothetical protein
MLEFRTPNSTAPAFLRVVWLRIDRMTVAIRNRNANAIKAIIAG